MHQTELYLMKQVEVLNTKIKQVRELMDDSFVDDVDLERMVYVRDLRKALDGEQ